MNRAVQFPIEQFVSKANAVRIKSPNTEQERQPFSGRDTEVLMAGRLRQAEEERCRPVLAGPCTDAQLQLWQLLVQYHKGLKSDSTNDGIAYRRGERDVRLFGNYVAYVTACLNFSDTLQRISFTKGPHRTVALWAALMRLVENRTKQDAQEPLWIAIRTLSGTHQA